MTEEQARRADKCPVCGGAKPPGAVVCFGDCYRRQMPCTIEGFKFTVLPFDIWVTFYRLARQQAGLDVALLEGTDHD